MRLRQAARRIADLADSWSAHFLADQPSHIRRTFDSIYDRAHWGSASDGRGLSGPGSTIEATAEYRQFIESLVEDEKVLSVVDAGCGDWTFSQQIDWGAADYLGLDVVVSVIRRVQAAHETPSIRFQQRDLTEELPRADLLIVKDVLQHLPNRYIHRFILNNLQPGRFRIAVVTNDRTYDHRDNRDVRAGGFRGLDLKAPPFSLTPTEELHLFPGLKPEKVVQVFRFNDR